MITEVKWKPSMRTVKETVELDGKAVEIVKTDANGKPVREVASFALVAMVEDQDGNGKQLNLATATNALDKASEYNGYLYGFDDPTSAIEKQRANSIHNGMVAKAEEFKVQLTAEVKFAASRKLGKRVQRAEDKSLGAGKFEIKA